VQTLPTRNLRLFDRLAGVFDEFIPLKQPLAVVERGDDARCLIAVLRSLMNRDERLLVSLTSPTAYHQPCAIPLINSIALCLGLTETQRNRMSTALHEALVNAVVHGNLELHSEFQNSDTLFCHYERIEETLSQAPYIRRRVEIACDWSSHYVAIAVTDEGPGFDFEAEPLSKQSISGRGLSLIASLTDDVMIDQGGRRILMNFCV
jgi:anti-sigma regulatory factor (Ser/Thr protein kinase)